MGDGYSRSRLSHPSPIALAARKNASAHALSRQSVVTDEKSSQETLVAGIKRPQLEAKSREESDMSNESLVAKQSNDPGLAPIIRYLVCRELPDNTKEAKEIATTSQQYVHMLFSIILKLTELSHLSVVKSSCLMRFTTAECLVAISEQLKCMLHCVNDTGGLR